MNEQCCENCTYAKVKRTGQVKTLKCFYHPPVVIGTGGVVHRSERPTVELTDYCNFWLNSLDAGATTKTTKH